MNELVVQGYRESREVTRRHARSFFFASALLFGARKRAAYALYAACRGLDDLVDAAVAPPPERLEEAAYVLSRAMNGQSVAASSAAPWSPAQLAALSDAAARFSIPSQPFVEMVKGMEMDLRGREYRSWAELDLYCYRVAGTVGELMAPVLGCRDASALSCAIDLGKAMQLTNILRDVREDYERGRVYLPTDDLAAFGLTYGDLATHRVSEGWRALVRQQIGRARALYRSGAAGISELGSVAGRATVRVMGAVYGGILEQIEARDFDIFASRARVSGWRKAWLAARTLLPWEKVAEAKSMSRSCEAAEASEAAQRARRDEPATGRMRARPQTQPVTLR